MAIRFQCAACRQPIEVDDDWGGRVVACPYCRRAAAAPTASTLESIPVASPATTPGPFTLSAEASAGNAFAVTAFALAMLLSVVTLAYMLMLATHREEFRAFQNQIMEATRAGQSMLEAGMRIGQSNAGAMPGWLMMAAFLQLAALANWLTSIVLAILGLRRPHRRGLAWAALGVCALVMLTFCIVPPLLSLSTGAPGPANGG